MEKMLDVVICDDENEHRLRTGQAVRACLPDDKYRIITVSDHEALLSYMKEHSVALVLLDIELCGENGIAIGGVLHQMFPKCPIIFISSHECYAQDVYDVDHIAFLLKKDIDVYLPKAIQRFLLKTDQVPERTITLPIQKNWYLLNQDDIVFMTREGRKTKIFVSGRAREILGEAFAVVDQKMEDIVNDLSKEHFVICHKSFCVNWKSVRVYRRDCLMLNDGAQIPISRSHAPQVLSFFQKWSFSK